MRDPTLIELVALDTIEPQAVERLLDRAFGIDRHQRTAYRLRAGTRPIAGLSLAAVDGSELVGSIQCWPVMLAGDDGRDTPMVLVGPVAVAPERQHARIGRRLVEASLAAAREQRVDDAMMLVGDPEYYGRFFGFSAERTGRWRLPGPYEARRLLARGERVPDATGMILPRIAMAA